MPRPRKCRRICSLPMCCHFHAEESGSQGRTIEVTLEEFEAIRLIDYSGMTQEECAAQMLVARTTVQRIYNSARKKLAEFLIEGGSLTISGGDYTICGNPTCGGKRHCCNCPGRNDAGECDPENCPYW